MGTLYHQPTRPPFSIDLGAVIRHVKEAARTNGVTFSQAVEAWKAAEAERSNQLYCWNGDAWDEQIAGIGKELLAISEALGDLPEALRSDHPLQGETLEGVTAALQAIALALGELRSPR